MATSTKPAAKKATAARKTTSGKGTNKSTGVLEGVLTAIKATSTKEGISVKELAEQTSATEASVRRAITKLEGDGMVRKDGPGHVFPVGRSGRRSTEVVERDEQILKAIQKTKTEGITLEDVAEEVGTTKRLAYESVWRLRNEGKVARTGSTRSARWVAT